MEIAETKIQKSKQIYQIDHKNAQTIRVEMGNKNVGK